jgi:anti-sigma B factor antagonist
VPDHVENPDRFEGQLRGAVSDGAGGPVVYALTGEIDTYVADALEDRLRQIAAEHGEIIELDLAEVAYCDSSGLRVFIKLSNELAARGGRLRFVRPSPAVLRLLDLTNTASILGLAPGVHEEP